jgi:hypothetical protein
MRIPPEGLRVKELSKESSSEDYSVTGSKSSPSESESQENWWDYCPICNAKLLNQKCKYVCSNPKCNFFMSCSEFDL